MCVCICVNALGIVYTYKILHFINTLIIIIKLFTSEMSFENNP